MHSFYDKFRVALAASLAIMLAGTAGGSMLDLPGLMPFVASMGASAVILFAMPNSPVAQPWPLVGGHMLSATIGVLCARFIPEPWSAAAVAVGASILVMLLARCLHPPGGATSLIPILGGESVRALGFQFLLTPLALNLLFMLAASQLYRLLVRTASPPAVAAVKKSAGPAPLERLGIRPDDLHAALHEMHDFVDVSEVELEEIFELAAATAFRRELGELTCEQIMTRDVLTVEFGDELESVWRLMQQEVVRIVPVVDRGRHVLGVITLRDFFRHAKANDFRGLSTGIKRLLRITPEMTSRKPEVAGQLMSAPVVSVPGNAHIAELAVLMTRHGFHSVPIVDERNKLVGLVTQTDLIAAVYRLMARPSSGDDAAT